MQSKFTRNEQKEIKMRKSFYSFAGKEHIVYWIKKMQLKKKHFT